MDDLVKRPAYSAALNALESAHKACFDHPDRPLIGMSHGPFSGVNVALGIVAELEECCAISAARITALEASERSAFQRGAEEMREMAAKLVLERNLSVSKNIAAAIRNLIPGDKPK